MDRTEVDPRDALRCDLVCEGGGVKGIGLAGAYAALDDHGFEPNMVAGTSAGAITAALIAAGYRSDELKETVLSLDFRRFRDPALIDRIPLIGPTLSLLFQEGIYEGKYFMQWMTEMLARKNVRTFADLPTARTDQPWVSRLQVIVSDLTHRRLLVLPRDAALLGIDPREMKVADAVRMSISIPLFFEPVWVKNPKTGEESQIVDGGLLSNFPVWLFDAPPERPPRWPTFGLRLSEFEPKRPIAANAPGLPVRLMGNRGLIQLLTGLVYTSIEAHDRRYLEKSQSVRTIHIPTLGVSTVDFGLSRERASALFDSGRLAAEKFLSEWDYEAYLEQCRTGAKPPAEPPPLHA